MIQQSNGKGTFFQHARAIKNSARNMGVYVLGGRGTGKSRLLALVIALQDIFAHRPQVILDPLGTTGTYFLDKLVRICTYLPKSERAKVWERIIYIDMGSKDFAVGFPLYYGLGKGQSLREIAERYLTVIRLSNPALINARLPAGLLFARLA
jgi:hypothetical protein